MSIANRAWPPALCADGARLMDDLAKAAVAHGDDAETRAILRRICDRTDMGFAAIARVTEERWIACQVEGSEA